MAPLEPFSFFGSNVAVAEGEPPKPPPVCTGVGFWSRNSKSECTIKPALVCWCAQTLSGTGSQKVMLLLLLLLLCSHLPKGPCGDRGGKDVKVALGEQEWAGIAVSTLFFWSVSKIIRDKALLTLLLLCWMTMIPGHPHIIHPPRTSLASAAKPMQARSRKACLHEARFVQKRPSFYVLDRLGTTSGGSSMD